MVYPNLEAEMKRHGVTQTDIARVVSKRVETVSSWMNDKNGDFDIQQALAVRNEFFPMYTVEYLFAKQEPGG